MSGRLPRDATLVCVAGSVRAAAVSLVGVIIAIQLAGRGLSTAGVGLVIGTGIGFSALGTVVVGMRADRWGRRRTLIGLGLLCGSGYTAIAFAGSLAPLLLVAATTMLNGMGRDRGPASALEQAVLPATTSDERRTWTMAAYNAAVDGGHAVGALGAALPTVFVRLFRRHGRRRPCSNVRPVRHRGRAIDDPYSLLSPTVEAATPVDAAVGNAYRPADSRGRSQADPPVRPR